METALSQHFTYRKIFKFILAPIGMMVFISLYGIVDGFFIANYAGEAEFAGVNVIMPVVMVVGGIGFMFGTGGSALVGKYLGEQNKEQANRVFSMIVKIVIIVGICISIIGCLFIKPIAEALGKISQENTDGMVEQAIKYGRVLCLGQTFFMLQNVFQSFLVVAEKQKLGFIYTICAGISNMILDFLFIKVFQWGVVGAALATIVGYMIGSICPFVYFIKNKNTSITLKHAKIQAKPIMQSCFNGLSEFVSNISSSIVGLVFNIQLLKYFTADSGVQAYGTLMYVSFIFVATYIGYSIGVAPIISYNYGARNRKEINNILKKSLTIILCLAGIMFAFGEFAGPLFAKLYVRSNPEVLEITCKAFKIFSIQFLFCGFSIFLSSFFTALNNGVISAIISLLRTLLFQISFVLILPTIFGKEGVWWSIVLADIAAFTLSFIFLFIENKRYGYFLNKKSKLNDIANNIE